MNVELIFEKLKVHIPCLVVWMPNLELSGQG